MAVGSIGVGASRAASATVLPILFMVSAGHLLNDTMQSVLLSIYPLIKDKLALDFVHIGIITLVFQLTASVLQPIIGLYTDKHPKPFSLPFGMASTFLGMLALAMAGGFTGVLLAAALIGVGSSVFHPEASRVARLASGGTVRLRPVAVPGRRQCRPGDRAVAGGAGGDPQRPGLCRLVRAGGGDRHRDPVAGGRLVPGASGGAARRRVRSCRACRRWRATG